VDDDFLDTLLDALKTSVRIPDVVAAQGQKSFDGTLQSNQKIMTLLSEKKYLYGTRSSFINIFIGKLNNKRYFLVNSHEEMFDRFDVSIQKIIRGM